MAEESKFAVYKTGDKINSIINQINLTFESMQGISAASEQQTASMEDVSSTSHKLENLAEQLKNLLVEMCV